MTAEELKKLAQQAAVDDATAYNARVRPPPGSIEEGQRIRQTLAQPSEPLNISRAARTGEPYRDPRQAIPRPQTSVPRGVPGVDLPRFQLPPEAPSGPVNWGKVASKAGTALGVAGPALGNIKDLVDPNLSYGTRTKMLARDIAGGAAGTAMAAPAIAGLSSAGPIGIGTGLLLGAGLYETGRRGTDEIIGRTRDLANRAVSAAGGPLNYFTSVEQDVQRDTAGRAQRYPPAPFAADASRTNAVRDTSKFPVDQPAQGKSRAPAKPSIDAPVARVPRPRRAGQAAARSPIDENAIDAAPPQVTRRTLDTTPYTPEQQQAIWAMQGGNATAKPAGINYITNDQLFAAGEQGPRFTVPQDNAVYTNAPGNVTAAPGSNIAVVGPGERYFSAGNVAVPQAVDDATAPAYLSAQRQAAVDMANPVEAKLRIESEIQKLRNQGGLAEAQTSAGPAYARLKFERDQYQDMLLGKGPKAPTKATMPQVVTYDQDGKPYTAGGGDAFLMPDGSTLLPAPDGSGYIRTVPRQQSVVDKYMNNPQIDAIRKRTDLTTDQKKQEMQKLIQRLEAVQK
jgi:hypothetical protein